MCDTMPVKKQETSDHRSLRYGRRLASPKQGEEIVISGLSSKFSSCSNAYEIIEKLYNKMDLITGECRWVYNNSAMPARVGYISGAELFDCSAFGMTPHTADRADPVLRVLLENAIEAIMDAGINPEDLAGTRTAILGSVCNSESGEVWERENFTDNKLPGVFVASREGANILSYILKVNGPSIMFDTACSSTAYCLDQAYTLLRKGQCDAALVFGSAILVDPRTTSQFYSLGVLSPDGICKSFDATANGYARSEARCALFVQKAKDAKRIYAQLMHSKTSSDGFKLEGITFPSGEAQEMLLREVYEESGVDPKDVFFMEAHGTGTKVGDPEELNAIDRVFCKNRKEPLLIGSVKANLGHTEPVAALASMTKILLGMENGYIAPNIYFKTPRPEVPALTEGRLQVLLEKLPYRNQNAPVGIGSYGFGGANGHLLLRGFNKKEKNRIQFDGLPRLVCFGGRTEVTIKNILKDLTEREYNPEYIALLHSIFRKSSSFTHPYRGFAVVSDKGITKTFYQKQGSCSGQLFAVFSGLEDEWSLIGRKLIKFPLFKNSLERANKILSKNGTDITSLLITQDSQFSSKPLLNFIVQIGIIDTLKVLGLRFTEIFSASFGKILAAYYQETITLEEALSVASVLEKFAKLSTSTSKSNQQNGSLSSLQKELDKKFPKTKPNPFDAKALLNTKLSPLIKLPKTGTILEFGFGSFKAATKGKISDSLQVIDFASSNTDDLNAFFEALGRLYVNGFDMDLEKLYPAIQYPVSRGTPMISPLISWEHSIKKFHVKKFTTAERDAKRSEFTVKIEVDSTEWSFITGHVIDGRILFPATGYLYVVWQELAALDGLTPEEARVIFENVKFKRATPLTPTSSVKLLITIFEKSGYFEINEGGATIVTGYVRLVMQDVDSVILPLPQPDPSCKELNEQDVYKELKLRGYNYNGLFKAIRKLDQSFSVANVQWFKNWVSFMDNMLQLSILPNDTRNLYIPTGIDRIVINSVRHMDMLETFDGPEPVLPVYVYHDSNYCRGGCIEISGVKANSIPKRKQLGEPVLEKYQFVANDTALTTKEALRVNIQIALENHYRLKVKTIEVLDDDKDPLSPTVLSILGDIPLMEPDVNILTNKELDYPGVTLRNTKLVSETDVFIVFGVNILSQPQLFKDALTAVKDGYIITRQTTPFDTEILSNNNLEILTNYKTENDQQILLRVVEADTTSSTVIKIPNTLDDFSWLEPLKHATKYKQNVILLAQNETINGILGLYNCIKRECKTLNIRCVFTQDKAPAFDPSADFYREQLKKQFAVNIFKDGKWGTYRHFLLDESPFSDSEHAYVNTLKKGDLSTLKWIEGPLKFNSPADIDQELVQIYYASLNFKDIMTATGKISADATTSYRPEQDCVQGFEFVGKDMKGRRVMGMKKLGALSSIIMTDKIFLIPVPDNWTLRDAATVPVVYGTVLYALVYRAGIKRGQSILIHAGTGGIGQAAIRVALHYGLHVYTTVGTESKRQFIKDTFPQISDQQIGNSRDTSFEQLIMKQTKGRGVDLVLNSLADEKLQASVRCVAKGGHFVEIGKYDLEQDNPLPLKCFARGVSHHGVMLDSLFDQPSWTKGFLMDLIKRGMQGGAVQPLNRVVFQKDEIEEAFRYMAAGKHVGKVLIELRKEDELPQVIRTKCSPRYCCNSENTQVILGGLGGFGLELADWLVLRGTKKLVLTSRTGVRNGYQASRIRLWRSYGVHVVVSTANTATRKGCLELIREANKIGPVDSIFNLAVVLQDAVLENQSEQSFATSFEPKAIATAYLDEITRKHCPYLRTFVVFSSVSCGRGNAGQTNYGMANSIMERICEKRKQDNLPGLAIQWGAIADVGLVAEMQRGDVEMEIGGTLQQRLVSCLDVLDQLLRQNEPVVSSMVVAEKRLGVGAGGDIVSAVANVLGIKDLKTISLQASLAELGMDSMMSVEIKQIIETELDVVVSPQELRELSFSRLKEMMEDSNSGETNSSNGYTDHRELYDLIVSGLEEQDGSDTLVLPLKSAENNSGIRVVALPGIEGTYPVMATLANRLSYTVLCCQYLMEQQNSIEEIADTLIQELSDVFKASNTFKLICHSFGSSIALKIAEKLEAQGKEGKIVFIDGSPAMTHFLGRSWFTADSYLSVENNALFAISAKYLPSETLPKVTELLDTSKTYEEKVERLFEIWPEDKQRYRQYFPTYVKSAIARSYAFKISEQNKTKIKAQCLLCKAAESGVPADALPEDYGLSEVLETPATVVTFGGTHTTILENPELADCINKFLM